MRLARVLRNISNLAVSVLVMLGPAWAADEQAERERRQTDTGRFYLLVQAGQSFMVDEHLPGDVQMDSPNGFNLLLGGAIGYNFTDHWGVELNAQGVEPDLRSASLGIIDELSILEFIPQVRFRWPLGDGRLVPYATAGLGIAIADPNDTANASVRVETEETTIVGSVGVGLEYFVSPNVAIGMGLQSTIHPDQSAKVEVFDARGRRTTYDGDMNLTQMSVLGSLRLYPGQVAGGGHEGRRFFADHGPFDTDAKRVYLQGLFGYAYNFDGGFGGGVEQNHRYDATLGGALGMNLSRHWGGEVQLLVSDVDLEQSPYGKVGELGAFSVLPTARFRYPLRGGRLVPYATAGLGVIFMDVNDRRPLFDAKDGQSARYTPHIDVDSAAVAGSVGVGLEYFLNGNLSVGLKVPFIFAPDFDTVVVERAGTPKTTHGHVNPSSATALLSVTAYLP